MGSSHLAPLMTLSPHDSSRGRGHLRYPPPPPRRPPQTRPFLLSSRMTRHGSCHPFLAAFFISVLAATSTRSWSGCRACWMTSAISSRLLWPTFFSRTTGSKAKEYCSGERDRQTRQTSRRKIKYSNERNDPPAHASLEMERANATCFMCSVFFLCLSSCGQSSPRPDSDTFCCIHTFERLAGGAYS